MNLGYGGRLHILAFDHRGSFQRKFFGVQGDPTPEQTATISDAKRVIYEGMLAALERTTDPLIREAAGILVDEQFGADIANDARNRGVMLAMPVEKSGQDEFDFQYGDDFPAHITDFDPTFSKVLVRYNPEGDGAMNERQTERLRRLGTWLHANDRRFLFELLVPPEPHQLETVAGDADRYDRELRAKLMLTAISELQQAGVEPDIWKIEGIDDRDDCERISEQCRAAGRDRVVCVVLGRGADDAAVDQWLKAAAGVAGYVGFAIGRTIWWDPLKGYVDGALARDAAGQRIAENYLRFVSVYRSGEAA
jgi:myo-inositol catabolism protein IolC